MTFGFEASNSTGKVTLSATFPSAGYVGKATFDWYGISFGVHRLVYNLPASLQSLSEKPICFIEAINNSTIQIILERLDWNGVSWDYVVFIVGVPLANAPPIPVVRCFTSNPTLPGPSAESHGLVLKDENSVVVFDSGWDVKDLLNIRDIVSVAGSVGANFTTEAMVKPAFAELYTTKSSALF